MNARFVLILILPLVFVISGASATNQAQSAAAVNFGEIDAFVRSEIKHAGIPDLSLAVVQGNEVIYRQGYGRADADGRAVTPQTPFIIGSIGKTFSRGVIKKCG